MNVALGSQASRSNAGGSPPPLPRGPSTNPAPAPPKKKSGCLTLIVGGLALIVLVAGLRACSEDRASTPTMRPAPAPAPIAPDPAETARAVSALATEMDAEANPPQNRLDAAERLINDHPTTAEAGRAKLILEKIRALVAEENLGKQWRYDEHVDQMTSKASRSASVFSTNTFEFGFPYSGPQNARLTLRRHPRWGNDVVLVIERGQLLCSSYDCAVRVRFDDDAPKTYSGTEPADNSSETIFIPGFNGFEARLRKAKKVLIEVNVYQQGVLQVEFNVEGFKPERLRGPATK